MTKGTIKLAVFIITKNEENQIEETIKSVADIGDQIIVVDSGSTDNTVSRARQAGATVIYNTFSGYGLQKQFGEKQCKYDWVLNIDADEPLTKKACQEIHELKESGELTHHDCWYIPIKTIYPHERIPAWWAYDYNQIRLYNKNLSGFSSSSVHDSVVPGENVSVGKLKGGITHYSHRNIHFQVEKFNRYTEMQVNDLIDTERHLSSYRIVSEFPLAFLKAYFFRRQFLYGLWGVSISISYAYSRFLRVAKFHERKLIERSKSQKA